MKLRLVASLCLALPLTAGTLHLTITDEHDAGTPARVYLTGPDGAPILPKGVVVYNKVRPDGQKEQHFLPNQGSIELDLPPGRYNLVIERGKEYLPHHEIIAVPPTGRLDWHVQLRRWVNMAARGWYSGDMHLHRPLNDMAVILKSEDLNTAVPITRWRPFARPVSSDPQLESVLSRIGPSGVIHSGQNRFFPVLNEELEPANAALLASRLGKHGTDIRYPMAAFGRRLIERGALVDSEKATQLELPVHAALGACNLIGLANNHFWRCGGYLGPWGAWPDNLLRRYPKTCAGFAMAGFEIYYALLNAGFTLSPSAGTASGVHPVPPGWSRVYVHVDGDLTPERWFDALESGHSFVTTGPMLLLTVDGHEPGEAISGGEFPRQVRAEIVMLSTKPVTHAEVVVNGSVHSVHLAAVAGSPRAYKGAVELTIKGSAWITARWLVESEKTCNLAHTAPVYIRNGDAPIPLKRHELQYLLGRTDALIKEVETGRQPDSGKPTTILTPGPGVKAETLRLFREARSIYAEKLRAATRR